MRFNLKELRLKRGLSQIALAEKSGVERVTINRMENGKLEQTTSGTLVKLADALETTIDSLIVKE